ncbi:MAG: nucleotidyl transferase AbiEii/AbiGii toxin family protein [Opitutales bacterium]|nr:nucleotidyl transferase AbiEii/AbiGii toxin family protein [Opitutales bacterium]
MKNVRNMAASVHQRLLNRARNEKRPFNELLQYYAMERFLYRLSKSPHSNALILKGALLLRAWGVSEFRPTMDIDLLGMSGYGETRLVTRIREITKIKVEEDGLRFDPQSIRTERITEDADYKGIRIRFRGTLGNARINMQIDVGFGDIVYPEPQKTDLPTMLDFPAPKLLCYTRESAIAEKFQAMINLGLLNSRMKDFYDVWILCRQCDFDGSELAEAVRLTFDKRETGFPDNLEVFEEVFIKLKQVQWAAFHKHLEQDFVPASFSEIAESIGKFLKPINAYLKKGKGLPVRWTAPGPWSGNS